MSPGTGRDAASENATGRGPPAAGRPITAWPDKRVYGAKPGGPGRRGAGVRHAGSPPRVAADRFLVKIGWYLGLLRPSAENRRSEEGTTSDRHSSFLAPNLSSSEFHAPLFPDVRRPSRQRSPDIPTSGRARRIAIHSRMSSFSDRPSSVNRRSGDRGLYSRGLRGGLSAGWGTPSMEGMFAGDPGFLRLRARSDEIAPCGDRGGRSLANAPLCESARPMPECESVALVSTPRMSSPQSE
jgi:hypothetical protein